MTESLLTAADLSELVAGSPDRVKELARTALEKIMESGSVIGTLPPRSKLDEASDLQQRRDELIMIAQDPARLEGDRQRAQQMLIRLEQLMEDIFGERA